MSRWHQRVGWNGERIAEAHLLGIGYRILGRNIRVGRHDEIDLLAFDPRDQVIVFCEVKSRGRFDADFHPLRNLTYRKRCSMKRAARHYVAHLPYETGYRIDVIAIAEGKVLHHIENL